MDTLGGTAPTNTAPVWKLDLKKPENQGSAGAEAPGMIVVIIIFHLWDLAAPQQKPFPPGSS